MNNLKWFFHIFIFSGALFLALTPMTCNSFCLAESQKRTSGSFNNRVRSTDLIENSGKYNGRIVIYEGEVIDPILFVGDKAWIAVNDDHYSKKHRRIYEELRGGNSGIPVLVDRSYAERIRFTGSYDASGDRIRVTGVFHESNPGYGGELMIEASSVEWIKEGHKIEKHSFGRTPIVFAALFILTAYLLILWLRERRRAERTEI